MSAYAVYAVSRMAYPKGSELLVLLALADIANDQGVGVMPDMEELGRKINLAESEAMSIVSDLIGRQPFSCIEWWMAGEWTMFRLPDVDSHREHEQDLLDYYVAGIQPPMPPGTSTPSLRTRLKYVKAIIPPDVRWAVWERDNFTCKACGTRQNLSIDHIKPESKGGTTELDNLQTLCKPCNSRKGNRE